MKLSFLSVVEGVRLHLSPAIAAAMAAAAGPPCGLTEPRETVEDEEVGGLLLGVLLPSFVDELDLAHVQLTLPGEPSETILLGPADAFTHPMLAGMPETLAAAIGAPVVAGARAHFAASNAPTFLQVDVAEAGELVMGTVRASITGVGGATEAVAFYGASTLNWPVLTTRSLQGGALYQVGRHARSMTQAGGPPPSPLPATAPIADLVGSGSIH